MHLIIDNANLDVIRTLYSYFPVSGVTTNPSILSRVEGNPYEILSAIREFIGDEAELHVQVISRKAEEMAQEAHRISNVIGGNLYIKIPVNREGLKAIKLLKRDGIKVTATAVYTSAQAYLAGLAGADYVAPYVNRIDNLSQDGVQVVRDIQDIFDNNGMSTRILAASFKNTRQVIELAKYGIAAATLAPDVMENLLANASVDGAIDSFVNDFENAYGEGATMMSLGESQLPTT